MKLSQAKAEIANYQAKLQERLFEIENKYDAAVLLIAGGALTFSANIVSNLEPPLQNPLWLKVAWIAWGLCLVFAASGHLVSAAAHRLVIQLLSKGNYDPKALEGGILAKIIQPLNGAAFVLLVAGFIAFGNFAFVNLDFGVPHDRQDKKADYPAATSGAGSSSPQLGPAATGERPQHTDHGGELVAPAAGGTKAETKAVTPPPATPLDREK